MSELIRAIRRLSKNPGYAFAAIVLTAIGIGCTIGGFSAVYVTLLRPLPWPQASRLFVIQNPNAHLGIASVGFSEKEESLLASTLAQSASVAEFDPLAVRVSGFGSVREARAGVVSPGYFALLGVQPTTGVIPWKDGAPTAVISARFFNNALHGNSRILGRVVSIGTTRLRVSAVLPAMPAFPSEVDVYVPTIASPVARRWPALRLPTRILVGRLSQGVTLESLNAQLRALSETVRNRDPDFYPKGGPWSYAAAPVTDLINQGSRGMVLLLLGASLLLLGMTAADLLCLAINRDLLHERELAIREALGASRWHLCRQAALEGAVTGVLGACGGLVLGRALLVPVVGLVRQVSPRPVHLNLTAPAVVLSVGGAGLIVSMISVLPRWLRSGNRANWSPIARAVGESVRRRRTRRALVGSQVAASLMLIAGAAVLLRSSARMRQVEIGFAPAKLVEADVVPPSSGERGFSARLLQAVRALPGTASAAITSIAPLSNAPATETKLAESGGRSCPAAAPFRAITVTPSYFSTLGVPLIQGRGFMASDGPDAPKVAIVDESLARECWPGASPVGHRISLGSDTPPALVVGIVGNVRYGRLREPPRGAVYFPRAQVRFGDILMVRAKADSRTIMPGVRDAVFRTNSASRLAALNSLESILADQERPLALVCGLIGALAAILLLIAVAGVAATSLLAASERRGEIAVRLALGARQPELTLMLFQQYMIPVLAGVAAGSVGALLALRALRGLAFGIPAVDPLSITAAAGLLVLLPAGIIGTVAFRACRERAVGALRENL